MAFSTREDKLWAVGFMVFGVPAMIAGFVQGHRHNDAVTMAATIGVIIVILSVVAATLAKAGAQQAPSRTDDSA